jgi:hypothetical protein
LYASFAAGASAQQQSAGEVYCANQGTVGVITGMEGGTYAQTAADLTILDDGTLRVLPIIGKGSLQHLSDILYLRGIDVGFVQAGCIDLCKTAQPIPDTYTKYPVRRQTL